MKLIILGPGDANHTAQLAAAGRHAGHDVHIVPFEHLVGHLGQRKRPATLVGDSTDLMTADAVLVRGVPGGSLEQVVFRMDALHRLQRAGVPVINPPAAIEACVDKYLATARLHAAGLPVPPTIVCEHADDALAAFAELGGDVVLKPVFGSDGRGICRLTDAEVAGRVFHALQMAQCVLYLQQYVRHPGYDVRVLVIGGEPVAWMRRRANSDFRTNIAQGGRGEPCDLPPSWGKLACDAVAAVGAVVAGVDLLPGPDGEPLVLEVNSAPGFRTLTEVTKLNIAELIIRYVQHAAAAATRSARDGTY